MSPPIPFHMLLQQCWMERLHQCCQLCGEINFDQDFAGNNKKKNDHQDNQHLPRTRPNENLRDESIQT